MGRRLLDVVLSVLVAGCALFFFRTADASPKPINFTDARLKVEINATDGDAGLQLFLDGQAWNHVELIDPSGLTIVDVDVEGRASDYGLTELFSESSEPRFETFPLDQFKALFPEGTYTFRGTTIDDVPMTGRAVLSHAFPDVPQILSPAAGSRLRGDDVTVRWAAVTTPAGIDIDGYQVLVVQEDPVLRVFSADLPETITDLSIPAQFLQPRTEYKAEVLAIEVSGNQTLSELTFRTR